MTTAEELRKYADKALKEGGIMYFSDEYLDALASRAEAEQAETEKLREENASLKSLLREALERKFSNEDKLRSENANLRELADAVKEFVEDIHCEDCPCRRDCDDNNRIFCVNDFSYHAFFAMRELGIEVDE